MAVILESGYTLPANDEPLTHARIAHANNWITGGTITASSTAANFFADGPDNSLTYEKWQPSSIAATWENNFGSSQDYDYCLIAAHNLGTTGCSLQVQTYASGAYTDLIPTTAITDDMPIFCIFSEQSDTRARIRLTVGSAPTIGVIKFGKALQMPRPIFGGHDPLDLARQTIMRQNNSETGEFLGRSKQRVYTESSFDWTHLTSAWVRSNWKSFQTATEEEPFGIAWRPSSYGEAALCYTLDNARPTNMGIRDLMEVSVSVRALGYD